MNDTTFQGNGSVKYVPVVVNAKLTKPITNADRIRAMTDEELADYLYNHDFCKEPIRSNGQNWCDGDCQKCISDWLKSPVEVDNG